MYDKKAFQDLLRKAHVSPTILAKELCLSYGGVAKKIDGIRPWKKPEIDKLAYLLDLRKEQVSAVFGTEEQPHGYNPVRQYVEKRSRRVQLMFQPSVVKRMQALAKQQQVSVNSLCNEAVIEYLGERENHVQ